MIEALLMVTPQGQVKIMDFGLAQLSDQSKLTRTATILGTPAYMSPEQARRRRGYAGSRLQRAGLLGGQGNPAGRDSFELLSALWSSTADGFGPVATGSQPVQ